MHNQKSIINQLMENQGLQKKITVYILFLFELHRVVMGSMLLLFVPQKCGENICQLFDHINNPNILTFTSLIFNCLTFLVFNFLYISEVKRENTLISYLEADIKMPNDNDFVENQLLLLSKKNKESITYYDFSYRLLAIIAVIFFILNIILSSFTISFHYLDFKTITVLVTNIIFMALKFKDVYSIIDTEKHIFLSAFLKEKIQYNIIEYNVRNSYQSPV